jgi:hypothetical protein
MFAFTSLALLALAIGVRADLIVSTPPSATQCQDVTFQITGSTTGPFHAFIVDASNPCGDQLDEVLSITGSSFTWTPKANVAGKTVMIALENDDASVEGWSGGVTVAAGDDSCETGASSSSSVNTPAAIVTTPHSTTHAAAATYSAPVNAGSDNSNDGTVSDDSSDASRVAVGVSGMLALIGAAVVTFVL